MSMPENGLETEEALAAIAKLPEDVGKMVVQLATEESGWMAGNSVSVDSGNATF